MQVKKTIVSGTKLTSEIDLFSDLDQKLPEDLKQKVAEDVGNYLKEQVLLSVSQSKSPISGGKFKPTLSPAYAKEKVQFGARAIANLELTGEMLDQLDFEVTKDGLEFGIFGDSAPRADGHNNFSGASKLPQRKFLPEAGEAFKAEIKREAERLINDKLIAETSFSRLDFAQVADKEELYDVLKELFPGYTRKELRLYVMRNPQLVSTLDEFNLLRFLDGES